MWGLEGPTIAIINSLVGPMAPLCGPFRALLVWGPNGPPYCKTGLETSLTSDENVTTGPTGAHVVTTISSLVGPFRAHSGPVGPLSS